ncbi:MULTISPECIES: type IV pilin N-terminal domain-containing protein [unclassified Methanosarcina]|uniref:type IV pilin N-terminal domain-containing protein n=1 Tax=unclassified Methanosarcina TaxID=2644672 RepID=UPI00064FFC43|nr:MULTISPECIES: type IV pilin N-terminal domain-containing protein [unclassified Methanosarcina]
MVFEKLKRNSSGVSSVLGEILITGVFVLSLGSLFIFVNSIDTPADSTHISVEEWVDAPSNTIYLRHVGGEPIYTKDLKINVNIDGETHVYSSANISENLGGKSFWELADVIEINTSKEWGRSVPDEDNVDVKLIDTESREVLPKCRISFSP